MNGEIVIVAKEGSGETSLKSSVDLTHVSMIDKISLVGHVMKSLNFDELQSAFLVQCILSDSWPNSFDDLREES